VQQNLQVSGMESPATGSTGMNAGNEPVGENGALLNNTQDRITLTVKSFATFREIMDPQIRMDLLKGATVRTLLTELTGRYEGLGELLFAAPGTLRDFVNILKNGRNVHFLAGLDTPLDDGDVIALFPPVAGG
jgi:molybdopterin synthase sulfur carrier subunit